MADRDQAQGGSEQRLTWTGYMRRRGDGELSFPAVCPIFWGKDFELEKYKRLVQQLDSCLGYIVGDGSPFMKGLEQYRVERATVTSRVPIPEPAPPLLKRDEVVAQLQAWIRDKRVPPPVSPDRSQEKTLYLIFAPPKTALEFQGLRSPTNLVAYHHWDYAVKPEGGKGATMAFREPDLFFSVIAWPAHASDVNQPLDPEADPDLTDVLTQLISNELAEAFTDSNGKGFRNSEGREICDVCESNPIPDVRSVRVNGWLLQTYWSNDDQRCIAEVPTPASDRASGLRKGENPDAPSRLLTLVGYLGSGRPGYTMLYLGIPPTSSVEIPDDQIVRRETAPLEISPVPVCTISFRRDAMLSYGLAKGAQPSGTTGGVDPDLVEDAEHLARRAIDELERAGRPDQRIEELARAAEDLGKASQDAILAAATSQKSATYLTGPIHETYRRIAKTMPTTQNLDVPPISNEPSCPCASEGGTCPSQGTACEQ